MKTLREQTTQTISILLRLHDKLEDQAPQRQAIARHVLFLMDAVKAHEFEQSFKEAT